MNAGPQERNLSLPGFMQHDLFIYSHHMSLEVVFGLPRVRICAMLQHTVASHMRRLPGHMGEEGRAG